MKRLLCIVGGMNVGGAETLLMKIYRDLDKSQYQMDFAVAITGEGAYDQEILSLGGRIFHISPKSAGAIKNFTSIRDIVRDNGYQYVLRVSQHSLSALELWAAKLGGAKVRAFRSSNSNTTTGKGVDLLLHKLCRFMPKIFANVRFAPSTEAAEFMFGKGCLEKGRAVLLPNAIRLEQFSYALDQGQGLRRALGLENRFVVGHIGRLNQQKNHGFLLEIFQQICRSREDAVLMLVGKGELEQSIRDRAQELGIADKVILTGVRQDIQACLSAMDVFVFPSLYEGMPNTVIEAQTNGLHCLVSDTITKEANITGLVEYLPLTLPPEEWAQRALAVDTVHRDQSEKFIQNRYNIDAVVQDFTKLIFKD